MEQAKIDAILDHVKNNVFAKGEYTIYSRMLILDPEKWKSIIYVYSEVYAKNDRLLWNIPDDSCTCTLHLVEQDNLVFLFYERWNEQMELIAFTTKDIATNTNSIDKVAAWWN